MYLTIAILASAVAIAQRLGGMGPLAAGFFGAALSLGWAATQIRSASAPARRLPGLIVTGPVVLSFGLAVLAILMSPAPTGPIVVGWIVALVLAGAGDRHGHAPSHGGGHDEFVRQSGDPTGGRFRQHKSDSQVARGYL